MKDKIREILLNCALQFDGSNKAELGDRAIRELAELFEGEIEKYKISLEQHSFDLQNLAMRFIEQDKEIAELKKRLLLYEKKEGDAFLDKIP
jgi:hypothetical protein